MTGIIVVGGVLLHLAAQQHAAAYHDEIGGQTDQYPRHKEQCQRLSLIHISLPAPQIRVLRAFAFPAAKLPEKAPSPCSAPFLAFLFLSPVFLPVQILYVLPQRLAGKLPQLVPAHPGRVVPQTLQAVLGFLIGHRRGARQLPFGQPVHRLWGEILSQGAAIQLLPGKPPLQ